MYRARRLAVTFYNDAKTFNGASKWPWAHRAWLTLLEKKVDFTLVPISLNDKPKWYIEKVGSHLTIYELHVCGNIIRICYTLRRICPELATKITCHCHIWYLKKCMQYSQVHPDPVATAKVLVTATSRLRARIQNRFVRLCKCFVSVLTTLIPR